MKYVITIELELETDEEDAGQIEARLRYLLKRGIHIGDNCEILNVDIGGISEP